MYKIFCTHINEESYPFGSEEIPDLSERWLKNMSFHNIKLEEQNLDGYKIITKLNNDEKEMFIVSKNDVILLLYIYPFSCPSYLETLKDNEESEQLIEMLNIDVDDVYEWVESDVIN